MTRTLIRVGDRVRLLACERLDPDTRPLRRARVFVVHEIEPCLRRGPILRLRGLRGAKYGGWYADRFTTRGTA